MNLYLDPGTAVLGAALFLDRRLIGAMVSRAKAKTIDLQVEQHCLNIREAFGHIVAERATVEWMSAGGDRVPAQDLINVQAVGSSVAGLLASAVSHLSPTQWKGNIPKRIHHPRIVRALEPDERAVSAALFERARTGSSRGNDKEALDAVGMGLYDLQRTLRSGGRR